MQHYTNFAQKNNVVLLDTGPCQFCGAQTQRGVHECLEVFNLGFQSVDYSLPENHLYRFLTVDAHTLQHPEIHGRWSNHFHLTRLHLMLKHEVEWTYQLSPRLSDHLKGYKRAHAEEYLSLPPILQRGIITSTDVLAVQEDIQQCKDLIRNWAEAVYDVWSDHHITIAEVAKGFSGKKLKRPIS